MKSMLSVLPVLFIAQCAFAPAARIKSNVSSRALKRHVAFSAEGHMTPPQAVKSLSGVPFRRGDIQNVNDLRRIEYLTVTVSDMTLVARFYTEVLGAEEMKLCVGDNFNWCQNGAVRFSGDAHQAALLGLDIEDGLRLPDITSAGDHEVLARFFVLGNALVQLLQFVNKATGEYFPLWENRTSPVWVGQAHIDFWAKEGMDPNAYIADLEARSHERGMMEVKFNRPVPQETLADREKVPQSKYANQVVGGPFDGLAWAYFKGPVGEQYEVYQIDRTMKRGIGRSFCDRKAVSKAFVDTLPKDSVEKPLSQQNYGVFQYGYRTADLHKAVGFYTEVLGGDLVPYPTHGAEIMNDDSAHWMILANETLEAYAYQRRHGGTRDSAMRRVGVPNISSSGSNRLDHRFILFDNFVVEPLRYTDGLSFGADGFNPRLGRKSSPAYIGTVTAAFGLAEDSAWETYLAALGARVKRQGFHEVQLPIDVASFPVGHPFNGLEYGYAKGPDGEAIALARISGEFRRSMYRALKSVDAVSTMFEDTNPHTTGQMDKFCAYAQYDPNYQAYVA